MNPQIASFKKRRTGAYNIWIPDAVYKKKQK